MTRRQVSMADVARAAGVSQQTVSRVVNAQACVSETTRARIQAAMDELGFRPNFAGRALRGGSFRAIGLGIFDMTRAGNAATLAGVLEAARERDYAVTIVELDASAPARLSEAAQRLAALPVDGLVFNTNAAVADFDDFVPPAGLPCVLISMREHPRCATIDSDQHGSTGLAARHLIERGHREIRHIAGPEGSISAAYRLAGWRDALAATGLDAAEPLVGDWGADSGYELGAQLARDASMTALCAANDQMALGAIAALEDAGRRVPEDVSVMGVDDSLIGIVPKNRLSTVAFDQRERGRITFDCLLGQLDGDEKTDGAGNVADAGEPPAGGGAPNEPGRRDGGEATPPAIRLAGRLIERASVAAPR